MDVGGRAEGEGVGSCKGGEGVEGCGGFGGHFFSWLCGRWDGGWGGMEEEEGEVRKSWFWKLCSMSEWVGLDFYSSEYFYADAIRRHHTL